MRAKNTAQPRPSFSAQVTLPQARAVAQWALAVLLPVHVAAEGGHEAVVQCRVAAAEGACEQTPGPGKTLGFSPGINHE